MRPLNIITFIKKAYRKIFPEVQYYLVEELKDCRSILDLGCGYDSPVKYMKSSYKVGVDSFKPYLEESKRKKIHNKYILANVMKVKIKERSFDAVLALDILEHLNKRSGLNLIKKMEKWSKKKIIIYTPNGFLGQEKYDENPFQTHLSGWTVKDLERLGFNIYGIHGLKFLRKELGEIRFRPKFIWLIISDITQKITYHFPKLAFQLLAIKEVRALDN